MWWALAVFAGVQVVLAAVVEARRPWTAAAAYSYRLAGLRRLLAEEPGRPLVLALGTSRTGVGFRPDALAEVRTAGGTRPTLFNYGIAGTGLVEELVFLERLLAEGIHPDGLLVEILPVTLQTCAAQVEQGDLAPLSWQDLQVLSGCCSAPSGMYRRWLEQRVLPGFTARGLLLSRYGPSWLAPATPDFEAIHQAGLDRYGWRALPVPTPEQRGRLTEHARRQYAASLQQPAIGDAADRALRRLLAVCRRERIPVGLYLMPEGSAFRSWYAPATRAALTAYLGRVSRECAVPVLDAREWIGDEGFSDSHHLLPEAAAVFTRRFGWEALRPLLRTARIPLPEAER